MPQNRNVEFVEASIERMPFADGEFDLCVCFNGLHCVPDPRAAVAEMGPVPAPCGPAARRVRGPWTAVPI
jgi:ubiquinone/menaquinone biosynthesis C-methylase UbiE